MTFDKFTIKAQEAVQAAANLANANGQQAVEPIHLLGGIIEKGRDITNFLFQKLGINGQQIESLVKSEISHLPRVQGGEPYFSNETSRILQQSMEISKKMGDDFVSIEPLLIAILTTKDTP